MRQSIHSPYSTSNRKQLRAAVMAACAGTSLLWMANHALATQYTFTAGTSGEWTDPTNWTPTGTPMSGDDALVPATSTGTMTITGSPMSIGDLIYSSTTGQVLADGGTDATNVTLTLTGNGTNPLINLNSGTTSGNFTIQGANGSTGTGTLGLVLGASGDFNVTNLGPELIISADISQANPLLPESINKNGSGTLVMSGANSFSGAMELTQNWAIWDYSTNTGDKIAAGGSLEFNGGSLALNGNGTIAVNETVSSLNVVSGQNTLNLNTATQSLNLNVGPINRTNNGGVINFVLNNGGGTPTITTTTGNLVDPSTTNSYGIIGGWATVGSTDWATNSGGNIVALSSYTDQANVTAWGTDQNITNTSSGAYNGILGSSLTISSLKFNNPAASTVTIGSGATLTIGSGGIMNTQASGTTQTFVGGSLTSGGQDLIFNNTSSGVMNVSSTITDNSAGSVGLTKTGSSTLILSGSNTFSGQVIVNGGTLSIDSTAELGTGASAIILGNSGSTLGSFNGTPLASGSLNFESGFDGSTLNRPIDLGTAGGAVRGVSISFTIASTISGGSLLRFGKGGTTILTGTNTYTGQTQVQAGALEAMTLAPIGTPSSIGTGTSDPTLLIGSGTNAATFTYGGTTDANTGRNLILSGTSGGGWNVQIINSNTVAVNSISSTTNAGSFGKYGPGTLEVTGSGANFSKRIDIARGTYQFDDPTGLGTSGSVTIGNGNAASLIYGGTTPFLSSAALTSAGGNPVAATIESKSSVMTLTGGFNSAATNSEVLTFGGNGGIIMNSGISGTHAISSLIKNDNGTLELMGTDSYSNTIINGGTLILDNSSALGTGSVNILSGGAMQFASGFTSAAEIPTQTTPLANAGTIDMNQGKLVVEYTGHTDPYSTLKAQVKTGFNGGAWNGPGINSSAAHAAATSGHPMSVAIAEGSSIMGANYGASSGSYGGQGVDSTSVVLGYTYAGDATMNGTVDSNDFDVLAANFGKTGSGVGWVTGDFNYDGTVNALDFNALATNYGAAQLPAALPDGSAVALGEVVPEPTGLAALAILSALAIRRRRQI